MAKLTWRCGAAEVFIRPTRAEPDTIGVRVRRFNLYFVTAVAAATGSSRLAGSQETRAIGVHASAIALVTSAAPGFAGRRLTEGYLTQPSLMVHYRSSTGRVTASATINLEHFTLQRGELNAGIWGEGYIDRRHPHTVTHEAMLTFSPIAGTPSRVTPALSVGKGFVPFGSDDPMSRPFVKFPVNHHLSQLLERAQVIAAVASRNVVVEATLFNGDEPQATSDFVNLSRFADSWAVRATAWLGQALEISASHARVTSPEVPDGSGLDQSKWNVAARAEWDVSRRAHVYGLAEFSRTRDYDADRPALGVHSVLAESSVSRDGFARLGVRLERTQRLEEERLADPFRSPRPHYEAHQLGTTRWDAATANVTLLHHRLLRPFVEVSHMRAKALPGPSFFEPALFYGSSRMWSLSIGAMVGFGQPRRMGRYGPALRGAGTVPHQHH